MLEVLEEIQMADKFTPEQIKRARKICPNGVYIACVKQVFTDGRHHYTDALIFDENEHYIDSIASSELGLYSTI